MRIATLFFVTLVALYAERNCVGPVKVVRTPENVPAAEVPRDQRLDREEVQDLLDRAVPQILDWAYRWKREFPCPAGPMNAESRQVQTTGIEWRSRYEKLRDKEFHIAVMWLDDARLEVFFSDLGLKGQLSIADSRTWQWDEPEPVCSDKNNSELENFTVPYAAGASEGANAPSLRQVNDDLAEFVRQIVSSRYCAKAGEKVIITIPRFAVGEPSIFVKVDLEADRAEQLSTVLWISLRMDTEKRSITPLLGKTIIEQTRNGLFSRTIEATIANRVEMKCSTKVE